MTDGCVGGATDEALQSKITLGSIVAGIAAIWCWANRESRRRKRQAGKRERQQKETASSNRRTNQIF